MNEATLSNQRIVVVGATRGLGRGMALALAEAGAQVVVIGRDAAALESLASARIQTLRGDATDANLPSRVLDRHDPSVIVMVAGAAPLMRPLSQYSWEALSRPWEVDVKAAFRWIVAALQRPMAPGGRFVTISSGAALHGSPLSGGYAGAKQTQRFLARYAADEARTRELDLCFQTLLPQLNPNTQLGRAGIEAYAARAGVEPEAFVRARFGDQPLSPSLAGAALVELLSDESRRETAEFVLTGGGLRSLEAK